MNHWTAWLVVTPVALLGGSSHAYRLVEGAGGAVEIVCNDGTRWVCWDDTGPIRVRIDCTHALADIACVQHGGIAYLDDDEFDDLFINPYGLFSIGANLVVPISERPDDRRFDHFAAIAPPQPPLPTGELWVIQFQPTPLPPRIIHVESARRN